VWPILDPAFVDPELQHALAWLWRARVAERHAWLPVAPPELVFVDVETTRDRIVELAVVRLSRGRPATAWQSWLDPGAEGHHKSKRYWNTPIHGLTERIVAGAPTFAQAAPTLARFFAPGPGGAAVMVGHNVSFERRFLLEELARTGGSLTSPTLCTLALARALYPSRRDDGDGYTLDELASLHDVRNPAPHRAMGDTLATVGCLLAMLERNPDRAASAVAAARSRDASANPWTRTG
jgi:DNA polymerase-3 subunit epsilon